jgi:hypothetical protein
MNFSLYLRLTSIDDAASDFVLSRPINVYPTSETTFQLARHWLDQYEREPDHPALVLPKQSPPSRLLSISENESNDFPHVVLVNPQKCEKYAALSYCWGHRTEQDFTYYTTTQTIARGYSGIPLSELPSTIQDAVFVTQKLGLRYLWVDRLCIVQDDENDLYEELGKMPSIYSFAYVTISAASAESSTAGFLSKRYDRTVGKEVIRIKIRTSAENVTSPNDDDSRKSIASGEQTGPINLLPMKTGQTLTSDITEPIEDRAWTMQEQLLSRKLLFFGSRQLRWVCGNAQYVDGGRNDQSTQLPFPFLSVNKRSPFHPTPAYQAERNTTQYSWDAIISKYSKRQLSKPEDKLAALGGLASRFADFMGYPSEDYLGGVWRQDFITQLLWMVQPSEIVKRPPKFHRPPSWSWASVDGEIDSTGFEMTNYQFVFWDHYNIQPTILEVQCVPVSSLNPFGAVSSGYLKCRGYIRQVHLINQDGEIFLDAAGSKARPHAYFDTTWDDDEIDDGMRHPFCLVVASASPYKYAGLILVPTGENEFRREGMWKFDVNPSRLSEEKFTKERKKWFESCEITTVVIN